MFRTALLLLLTAAVFAADQQPTVLGATSGLPQNLQAGDRLKLPTASGGFFTTIDPGAQTATRVLSYPVTSGSDTLVVLGIAQAFSAKITFPASATGAASINLPHGTAPTSPVNGDVWTTTGGLYTQINGATVGPLGTGGGGGGGVSSVAATVPSIFSISGSPITTSGTLAMTYSGTALPIANGGTGQTTASAAFDALSPMTQLGDLIYGGNSGTNTRLIGNATTTKKFLTQTGTGSASAAPAYATIVAADVPNLPGTIITSGVVSPQFGGTGVDTSAAANGKVLIGTGTGLALSTLTAGTNVTITNGSGTITIAASGGGGGTAANYTAISDAAYTMLSTDAIVAETTVTATRIITLPAASAVPVGRQLLVKDLSGSLTQTINLSIVRAGSDTIENGTIGWTIRTPKGWRAFESDGVSNWHLVGMSRDVQIFTTAGTFTWNAEPGAKLGHVELISGGGGGAGGAQEPSGTAAVGGGAGAGGGFTMAEFLVADAGTTAAVIVGAGGTSGAGGASTGTAGSAGGNGGDSRFAAGTANVAAFALAAGGGSAGGAGSGGAAGGVGQGAFFGGTAGSANSAGGGGGNAGFSFALGSGGGGSGGGNTTAPAFGIGGHGGSGGAYTSQYGNIGSSGNSRGQTDGAAGGSPTNITPTSHLISAPGGGGGASSVLTVGGAGGAGAAPGGGGGGGGGAINGHAGGAGGAGGAGAALVTQGL